MIKIIDVKSRNRLADYEAYVSLFPVVKDFRSEAEILVPKLDNRRVWMVNSTDRGGGVAEMMPTLIDLLRQLGLDARWAVMGTALEEFFPLTKKIHNLIHGNGTPEFSAAERDTYERVNAECAEEFSKLLRAGDIVVIHDPQPMAMAGFFKDTIAVHTIWRSHIGLDEKNPQTEAAWRFLEPYFKAYDLTVFSAPEYIPDYQPDKFTVIAPAIDPLSHKNRDLNFHKLVGILTNAGILPADHAMLTPPFADKVRRLRGDGSFVPPGETGDFGLLSRPIVTQISRWDRLKGFLPLMEGFIHLKRQIDRYHGGSARHKRRLELVRLVFAGPDPDFVKDDPEGREVLEELKRYYCALSPALQQDIVLLLLPMSSRKENELIVNALQRSSSIIVQNSLREGFGLTATEAMWKLVPFMGSTACGLRQQVRNRVDGLLIARPEDKSAIAEGLNQILADVKRRQVWAYNAQKRVLNHFLVFNQLSRWLNVFVDCVNRGCTKQEEKR
ncbi:MAG: glycosyltransferase [Desulfobacterales bacterium]